MLKKTTHYIKTNLTELILLAAGLLLTTTLASYIVIERKSSYIFNIDDVQLKNLSSKSTVAIVFGGGVKENEPLPLVRERLDRAKDLLDIGYVDALLLSGDNRSLDYNEPAVMFEYLVNELGVEPEKLQPDYAGRSTYETCERANKVFGISNAFLVSESTHLPRAVYLCRHFGIEAYGINSDGQASSGLKIGQRWREVLARDKAILNIYIYGEDTILGDPISLSKD